MKLIINDFKEDKEYVFTDVSDDSLDYYINNYKTADLMDVIVWDFDSDDYYIDYNFKKKEEYYTKGVRDEELEYVLKYCKKDFLREKEREWRKIKVRDNIDLLVALFNLAIILVAKSDVLGEYVEHFMLDDYNIFKGNNVIVSEEEVDDICETLEKQLGVTILEDDKDEYLLLDAINRNENLTKEEKKLSYGYINLILDNPYLDKQYLYKSLLNLDISYVDRPQTTDEAVGGIYSYFTKDIDIYETKGEYITKLILMHEMVHCIYHTDANKDLPRFFLEGFDQLLTNEYFLDDPFMETGLYSFEVAAIKMLCDVTSSDAMLKVLSYGDTSYITEEMGEHLGSEKEAKKAIKILSTILDEHLAGEELSYSSEEIYEECISKFDICHEYKIKNDPNYDAEAYLHNKAVLENVYNGKSYDGYIEILNDVGIYKKAYFSSKLKAIETFDSNDYEYTVDEQARNGISIDKSTTKVSGAKVLTR